MTSEQWKHGRKAAQLTQVSAAHALKVSQPYLSQLEKGLRLPSPDLARRAAALYKLPNVLPLPEEAEMETAKPHELQEQLASLGYPAFEHVRSPAAHNPAAVVLSVLLKKDLDTRLVEPLPWVLSTYTDLTWNWLRDHVKLHDAQNRLGYLVHLAKEVAGASHRSDSAVPVLSKWEEELESARLAREGTLCRDSMPERERAWLRTNRPEAAAHWNLLTSLSAEQLPYAAH